MSWDIYICMYYELRSSAEPKLRAILARIKRDAGDEEFSHSLASLPLLLGSSVVQSDSDFFFDSPYFTLSSVSDRRQKPKFFIFPFSYFFTVLQTG